MKALNTRRKKIQLFYMVEFNTDAHNFIYIHKIEKKNVCGSLNKPLENKMMPLQQFKSLL